MSIRELKAEKARLLEEYHQKAAGIDAEIERIRKARGTKIKEPDWSGYREPGRDRREHLNPHGE
jgi:hypothetical protein